MKSTLFDSETSNSKDASSGDSDVAVTDSKAKDNKPKGINLKSPKKSGIMIFEEED